ncbi:hypothetical protein AERO_04225 [Aeromicrobium fastidiosum]|uniref:hypothetical protein n=1 Tax=Aeromicrobium fastidiosum TaxID=52699 RepID=UPI0020235924|nr:hypothetical protein [Aeromicrobium fastidiosum]MCL8250580.1 hypothetical protein [Aeromicrobium fastidiosum]
MLDATGGAAYPPARNTWEFPPPPSSARWVWVAVLATLTGLVVAGGLVVVLARLGSGDLPGVIDDDELLTTIAIECSLMTSTVDMLPVYGTAQQQSETIRDQDRAVRLMVDAIRTEAAAAIARDRPSDQWLDDWESLVGARERLARRLLRDPNASLVVPVDGDGDPVTERMADVWLGDAACEVPPTIGSPDADALSG